MSALVIQRPYIEIILFSRLDIFLSLFGTTIGSNSQALSLGTARSIFQEFVITFFLLYQFLEFQDLSQELECFSYQR